MTQQYINVGIKADDGTGDTLRQAGIKINTNFSELFSAIESSGNINEIVGGTGISVENNGGIVTVTNTATDPTISAADLTGSVLAANVTGSSLTSVGTLVGLTVVDPIVGSINGSAPAGSLTGTVLAPNVINSSLTTVGNLVGLSVNGTVTLKNHVVQNANSNISCPSAVNTVIYTSTASYRNSIRLFVQVEGNEDGGGPSWETQACDIIAVKGYNTNVVTVSVFGLTYSGASALATFDGAWNPISNKIEISCMPVSATNGVIASVYTIELESND